VVAYILRITAYSLPQNLIWLWWCGVQGFLGAGGLEVIIHHLADVEEKPEKSPQVGKH
jgi:hypothetical protein